MNSTKVYLGLRTIETQTYIELPDLTELKGRAGTPLTIRVSIGAVATAPYRKHTPSICNLIPPKNSVCTSFRFKVVREKGVFVVNN